MKTLVEKLFGMNWRSTVSGAATALTAFLTALAAAPYQLGEVALIIPPEWKARLFLWSAIATVILKIINSAVTKDRAVSGTPSEGFMVGPKKDEPPRLVPNTTPVSEMTEPQKQ